MYGIRALDLIDIMIPIFNIDIEIWDLALRLSRVRRFCAFINKIYPGELVKMVTVRDLARELFLSSEESAVVTEISRLDNVLKKNMSSIAHEIPHIDPEASLAQVIDVMNDLNLECVPIAREEVFIGAVSEESLIDNARNVIPLELRSSEIATKNIETIDQEAPVEEAIGLMLQRGFRRIPIKNSSDRVVGILTLLDVVAALADIYRISRELRSIDILIAPLSQSRFVKKPIIVSPDTPVRDIIDQVLSSGVGCVLVGSGEEVQGIITEKDLVRTIKRYYSTILE